MRRYEVVCEALQAPAALAPPLPLPIGIHGPVVAKGCDRKRPDSRSAKCVSSQVYVQSMDLIILGLGVAIAGILVASFLLVLIWKIVGGAVDGFLDWLIYTFGNEQAVRRIEEKWRER